MDSTPVSLLDQLRGPARPDAWARFVHLYTPLLARWARRLGVPPADQPDLVQDVFVAVFRTLPGFRYDPARSFRAYLYALTANRWKDARRKRAAGPLPDPAAVPDPAAADPAAVAAAADDRSALLARALRLVRADFTDATWRAFWATAVEGRPAAEVAAELGVSPRAVYLARFRVTRRLRAEFAGLLD